MDTGNYVQYGTPRARLREVARDRYEIWDEEANAWVGFIPIPMPSFLAGCEVERLPLR